MVALLALPATGLAARWTQQTPATPSTAANSSLFGVSCVSRSWCMAVGGPDQGNGGLFAERWQGSKWSVVRAPLPSGASASGFNGVSCTSQRACTAVGYAVYPNVVGQVVERWNGSRWRIESMPTVPGAQTTELYAVSCASSTACKAVGEADSSENDALAESWDGSHWTIDGFGFQDGSLFGVSCTSSTSCTSVAALAVAESWDGTTWSQQGNAFPSDATIGAALYDVSCVSSSFCVAGGMGHSDQPRANYMLAEVWNGTTWIPSENRAAEDLYGVSCKSSSFCIGVGDAIESWNGSRWSLNNRSLPPLYSVSCPAAGWCMAVGFRHRRGSDGPNAARYS